MSDTVELSKEAKFQERDLKLAAAYCEGNEDFDSSFIDSLVEFFESKHYLTNKQYEVLSNIIEKCNMESWAAGEGLEFDVV